MSSDDVKKGDLSDLLTSDPPKPKKLTVDGMYIYVYIILLCYIILYLCVLILNFCRFN